MDGSVIIRGLRVERAGGILRNPSRPLEETSEEKAQRRMSTSTASQEHTHTYTHTQAITTNVTLAFEVLQSSFAASELTHQQ